MQGSSRCNKSSRILKREVVVVVVGSRRALTVKDQPGAADDVVLEEIRFREQCEQTETTSSRMPKICTIVWDRLVLLIYERDQLFCDEPLEVLGTVAIFRAFLG